MDRRITIEDSFGWHRIVIHDPGGGTFSYPPRIEWIKIEKTQKGNDLVSVEQPPVHIDLSLADLRTFATELLACVDRAERIGRKP